MEVELGEEGWEGCKRDKYQEQEESCPTYNYCLVYSLLREDDPVISFTAEVVQLH